LIDWYCWKFVILEGLTFSLSLFFFSNRWSLAVFPRFIVRI
jgi:hypothetical protein